MAKAMIVQTVTKKVYYDTESKAVFNDLPHGFEYNYDMGFYPHIVIMKKRPK